MIFNKIKKILPEWLLIIFLSVKYKIQKYFISKEENDFLIRSKLFYSKLINKNDLYFDVGANVGNRIITMLSLGAKIVAVEPQKSCQLVLESKFGNKISIVNQGLSSRVEKKTFYISNASVLSSFSKEWINNVSESRFNQYKWIETIDMEMTTLDNLIEQYGIPKFIKIDVEGYELEVLNGLNHKIDLISFEYAVPENIEQAILCIKRIYEINSNILLNYAIGESMIFELEKWRNIEDFLYLMKSELFIKSEFGDIYIMSS